MTSDKKKRNTFGEEMVTGIGLGSKETTTPAISVILCQPQRNK